MSSNIDRIAALGAVLLAVAAAKPAPAAPRTEVRTKSGVVATLSTPRIPGPPSSRATTSAAIAIASGSKTFVQPGLSPQRYSATSGKPPS